MTTTSAVPQDSPADTLSTWRHVLDRYVYTVMDVHDITLVDTTPTLRYRGRLRMPSEKAYDWLFQQLQTLHFVPLFRKEGDWHVIILRRGTLPRAKQRVWLAGILFVLTVLSVFFAGLNQTEGHTWGEMLVNAAFFAVPLLTILVAHEMGHYLVGRFYGTEMSLPYFIPAPIFLFGTMGAVINMVAPPKNRRQWLHIAAAGPLAGLFFAVPFTLAGLALSPVKPLPPHGYILEGNSILYLALKYLVFGRRLPADGMDVFLHPMAWAGWGGLLVTMLNLIPAAQLDGGHVARALLGARGGQWLTYGIIVVLLLMTFLWSGWAVWALIIFFFSRFQVAPLDDITEPTGWDKLLAGFMLILFILLFTPRPIVFVP
ncbi:MAG: site-2 protease family protein [Chloroflexi bacterium]|nr:site-2 protease family protein [Chloroflexota bacterium]